MSNKTAHPLDIMNAQRLDCLMGIAAAERCAKEELLQSYRADYARRAAHYRTCLEQVETRWAGVALSTRLLWRVKGIIRRLGYAPAE